MSKKASSLWKFGAQVTRFMGVGWLDRLSGCRDGTISLSRSKVNIRMIQLQIEWMGFEPEGETDNVQSCAEGW